MDLVGARHQSSQVSAPGHSDRTRSIRHAKRCHPPPTGARWWWMTTFCMANGSRRRPAPKFPSVCTRTLRSDEIHSPCKTLSSTTNWRQVVVDDNVLHGEWISSAPGTKVPKCLHPDTQIGRDPFAMQNVVIHHQLAPGGGG